MPNYRLEIEYDGTNLAGWQTQENAKTVQRQIENVLEVLLKEKVKIIGAGRTDAGVHATGQVANFQTATILDMPKIRASLNAMVGADIAILNLTEAPDDFHARYSATYRQYRYSLCTEKSAVQRRFVWQTFRTIDWQRIASLLPAVEGTHDFTAFCAQGSSAKTKVCNIHFFKLSQNGSYADFHIRADRFLYRMVRSLVGTLVDIGRGEIPADNLQKAIATGEKQYAGNTAPSCGLTLVEVGY